MGATDVIGVKFMDRRKDYVTLLVCFNEAINTVILKLSEFHLLSNPSQVHDERRVTDSTLEG